MLWILRFTQNDKTGHHCQQESTALIFSTQPPFAQATKGTAGTEGSYPLHSPNPTPQSPLLSTQSSALSPQHSVPSTQSPVPSPQHSVLSTQSSALSPQHSVLSTQSSALSPTCRTCGAETQIFFAPPSRGWHPWLPISRPYGAIFPTSHSPVLSTQSSALSPQHSVLSTQSHMPHLQG